MDKIIVRIPNLPSEVTITPDWLTLRAELIEAAAGIATVETPEAFDAAGELLRKITKASNAMEKFRKEYADPYNEAVRTIKKAADAAREPLEAAKAKLQGGLNAYAAEQQRKAEAERKRIEEAQRKEVERQMAERAAAVEEAAELGLEDELPEPVPVEVPAIIPQIDRARADAVRVQETVAWEAVNEDEIPEAFKTFDPRKVNAWLAGNKEQVKAALQADKTAGDKVIPGLRFRIDTKVISR